MKTVILVLMLSVYPVAASADFNEGVVAYLTGDYKRAYETMRSLAETTEHGLANYYLGMMYLNGQGVEQDYTEAGNWFRKAAELRIPQAQYHLGLLYLNGQGLPRDPEQAYAWFDCATRFQHEKSMAAIDEARQLLTEAELAEASKLSEKLVRDYGPAEADTAGNQPAP